MIVRIFPALILLFSIESGLHAQQNNSTFKVGDHLSIHMTGDLAKEYAARTGSLKGNEAHPGLEIETVATIAQELPDGQLRIEHTSHISRFGESTRFVTITATVDPEKILTEITPKGTPSYAFPGAEPKLTTEDSATLRLKLSDLKGLKLRAWTLTEEIGD